MEKLLEMARRLGREIARNERTTSLRKAQEEVNGDAGASQLLKEYQKQVEKVQQLEQQQKPIEVEDKHKLRDIEERLSTHPGLSELTRRQADFVQMMRQIKQAIDEQLEVRS